MRPQPPKAVIFTRLVEGRFPKYDEVLPKDKANTAEATVGELLSAVRRAAILTSEDSRGVSFVALGHHADDVVETWLLSLMYTGTPEVIPPVRSYFDGAVTVVRPLYELQRRELVRLARLADFPKPVARCRREDEARREKVRTALSAMGRDQNLVRRQLYWAAVRQYEAAEE